MFIRNKKAQSVLEYAMFTAVVVLVIIGLQLYVKRAISGRFKQSADQIGEQFTAGSSSGTGAKYTVEEKSQSVRREVITPAPTAAAWDQSSTIQSSFTPPTGSKITKYDGYEYNKTDYVTQNVKGNAVGTHDVFDSGKLGGTSVFSDD